MRRSVWIVFLSIVFFTGACSGNRLKAEDSDSSLNQGNVGNPEIVFEKVVADLGRIRQGEQVIAWFDYVNAGDAPLVIQHIRAGCGCTVPRWSSEPVEPGATSSFRVIFDSSGKRGAQDIKISVTSNAARTVEVSLRAIVDEY